MSGHVRELADQVHALLDAAGCEVILVEQPPQQAAWAAVNDRLMRAAAGTRRVED